MLAYLLHGLSQSMQVCGIVSPGHIYRGFKFNSCSMIAITGKLNSERTNSMIQVWWTDESGKDELVDESEVFAWLGLVSDAAMGPDCLVGGSSCRKEETEGFVECEHIVRGVYMEG